MDIYTIIDRIVNDIVGRIEADDGFAAVNVLREDKGVTSATIEDALKTIKVKGGKLGAAVVVAMPEKSSRSPDIPGPEYDLVLRVRSYERPLFNRSSSGTGLTAANLALRIEHLLDKVTVGSVLLVYQRTDPGVFSDGDMVVESTFAARLGLPFARRVQTPGIALAAGVATLSCGTWASTIRYTLDGSYPGQAAEAYVAPVTLTDGQTIRVVAYADGYQASSLVEATYTA